MHIRISRIYCIILCITNTDQEIRIMDSKGGKGDIKVYQPPGQIGSLIAMIERSKARYTPTCKIVDRSWISRKNNPANLERIDLDRNAEENSSFEREFPRENWPIDGASIAFRSMRCRAFLRRNEGGGRERKREKRWKKIYVSSRVVDAIHAGWIDRETPCSGSTADRFPL